MYNKKMIAMMLTLSMLAASLAGCAGGDDDDDTSEWAISMASDVEAVWVESGWDPIIPNLNDGQMCDVIISAMTKTEARDQVVDFTRAYYTSSQGVIGGSGAASITSVSDLNAAGTTIGVQSGTTSDLYANDNLAMATISAYEDFPSVISALNNGDVMYAMGDAPVLSLEGTLMVTFSDENFGFAVREDSGELLDALNMAIGAVVDSGEYDTIYGASFDGAVTLADDTTADTATAYPASPSEGSTLTGVLESGQLKICTDPFYPPFESYDADNNVVGFDADMAHAVVDEIAAHYMGTANPVFAAPKTVIKLGVLYDNEADLANFAPGFNFARDTAFADLNANNPSYDFQMVYASTACNEAGGQTAAQAVKDAGVVGVAGAACSGASMGANSILKEAGIPMISFASTSPALSDAASYAHFYRVVPSDSFQGDALADVISAAGHRNTAILSMTNAYGAGVGDAFAAAFNAKDGHQVCTRYAYDPAALTASVVGDAIAAVAVGDADGNPCDSVLVASYSPDGEQMVGGLRLTGSMIPAFGPDGMAGSSVLDAFGSDTIASNGIVATKPGGTGVSTGDFPQRCLDNADCASGIFTSELYDAVMMLGEAAMMDDGADMGMHVPMVGAGDGYAGASGTHVFSSNGDVPGEAYNYNVCTFHHVPTYGDYFNCDRQWTVADGLEDVEFTGTTVKIGFMGDITSPAIADLWASFAVSYGIAETLANYIAYNQGVQFQFIPADSACGDPNIVTASAQALVAAGVWGVVGAACSGASTAANAVFKEAGIPMISYASTASVLSDDAAHPLFWRVVSSDIEQSAALADVVDANGDGGSIAILLAQDVYTAGIASGFRAALEAKGHTICTEVTYDRTTAGSTTYQDLVNTVQTDNCGAVAVFAYNADGAGILEELATQGFTGQVYGSDGIASVTVADSMGSDKTPIHGVIATNPGAPDWIVGPDANAVQEVFPLLWSQFAFADVCNLDIRGAEGGGPDGISDYTLVAVLEQAGITCPAENLTTGASVPKGQFAESAFDASVIMGLSAFAFLAAAGTDAPITAAQAIQVTGQGFNGASGTMSFMANGDVAGTGYCIGTFDVASDGTVSFNCSQAWVDGVISDQPAE
jgi:branched-chain amino acid transport system substrate-binding protein